MAAKSAFIRARIEPGLKESAERILERLGLNPSTVISMLYRQIVLQRALPFEAALPRDSQVSAPAAEAQPATVGLAELRARRDEILRVVSNHGGRNVRVFGSVVRDEAGPDSDIDFLVDLEPGTSLLEHAALVVELRELLGREVDVVSQAHLRERVRPRILAEAVAL
jgi:addiction module RelB/DinJ family antitoxin